MKPKSILLAFAVTASCSSIFGATYIVGISPNYNAPDREAVFKGIMQFILEGASTNDEIVVYDALNLKQVVRFRIPEEKLFYRNPRARAQQIKAEVPAFREFLLSEHQHPPKMTGAIDTPGFLVLAGSQLRQPQQSIQVVLIGLPFFMSMTEPAFDQNGSVPSDGHITAAKESVFSTVGINRILEGVSVHYAYLHDCFVNQAHCFGLQRFYSLYVKEAGGDLVTWSPEIGLAFDRARLKVNQPCLIAQLDLNDSKVEMRRVSSRPIPSWFPPTNQLAAQASSISVQPIFVTNFVVASVVQTNPAPVSSQPLSESSDSEVVGIGIYWANDCDFDLYVTPSPIARELSFQNTTTPEGEYFHDFRGNHKDKSDYEFVQLKSGTDLKHVKAWVNFFSGRASSPIGIAILHHKGKTHESPFSFKGKSGNHGADAGQRGRSPYWVEINLEQLLGLP